jgi:hypothetical protein
MFESCRGRRKSQGKVDAASLLFFCWYSCWYFFGVLVPVAAAVSCASGRVLVPVLDGLGLEEASPPLHDLVPTRKALGRRPRDHE